MKLKCYCIFILKALEEYNGELTMSQAFKLFINKCEHGNGRLFFDDEDFDYDRNAGANVWAKKLNEAKTELIREGLMICDNNTKSWKLTKTGKERNGGLCVLKDEETFEEKHKEYMDMKKSCQELQSKIQNAAEDLLSSIL